VSTLAIALLQFAVAIVTVAFFGWGIWGVTAAMTVAYVGVGLPLTIRELAKAKTALPNWQQMKELIQFSLPFIPTGLFFFILMGGDQLFLARMTDDKEVVALYGLGHRIAMVISLLCIMPLTQVWSAWMYTACKEPNAAELLGKAITRILLVYMTATIGLALLKTEILSFLAAKEYLGAVHVIVPVAVANFFLVFANLMDASLWVTRRTERKPYIAAASAVLMSGLYYVLISRYHIQGRAEMGAAYATLVGLIGHCVFTYLFTRNVFTIKFEFGRLIIAGVIAGVCCLVGNGLGNGFLFVPYKLIVFFGWIAIIWFCGLLSKEEKRLILQQIAGLRHRMLARRS
jgi:O-antigen/teichoic acid export membrane protein